MWKLLLATTALAGGAVLLAQAGEPVRAGALAVYAYVAPDQACTLDPVACLTRKGAELAGIERSILEAVRNLQRDRLQAAIELENRQRELKCNEDLLAEGRRLWQQGKSRVQWRGVGYHREQLEDQLQLLFRERTVLEAAVSNLKKVTTELDTRVIDTRVLATRVSAERGLIGSRISLAHTGYLAANLDRIVAQVDRLTTDAEAIFSNSAAVVETLRTTQELNAAKSDPEPSAFDKWLRDGQV